MNIPGGVCSRCAKDFYGCTCDMFHPNRIELATSISLREQLSIAILNKINLRGGIKATELVLEVMGEINPNKWEGDLFQEIVNEMIKEGHIIELEYILPNMDYRVKSIYFPKGTILSGAKRNE